MTDNLGTSQQELLSGGFVEIINISGSESDVEFIVIENEAIRKSETFGIFLKIIILPKNMITRF